MPSPTLKISLTDIDGIKSCTVSPDPLILSAGQEMDISVTLGTGVTKNGDTCNCVLVFPQITKGEFRNPFANSVVQNIEDCPINGTNTKVGTTQPVDKTVTDSYAIVVFYDSNIYTKDPKIQVNPGP